MKLSAIRRRRRTLLLVGVALSLTGALLYGLDRLNRTYVTLLQQADSHYQARQYQEAMVAYQRVLAAPITRISPWLLRQDISPASVWLQIANCQYRLAEVALRHYQQAARDPRLLPRPSLEAVQRLLRAAEKAYTEVPQRDPAIYMAALANGARVAAWQLILAAFDEQTTGRRALRQQAIQAIHRATTAVDFAYRHPQHTSRHARMTALLLLETLTALSHEPSPPIPQRVSGEARRERLGDLLLRHTPELSSQERQRFQQFFFAMPLEAKEPRPFARQGEAGGGRQRIAH